MSGRTDDLSTEAVVAAVREVAGLGGFFALDVAEDTAPRGPAGGRLRAEVFAELSRAVDVRYATDEARVGTSIAHLGLAARLWSPVLACALLHGIVLDLGAVEWAEGSSALRLALPRARPARCFPSLPEAVYAQVDGALGTVERRLSVKIAAGLLAGNTASALAGSAAVLLRSRPDLRAGLTALTHDLLDTGRLRGTGRITGPDLSFRRRSCCLYYRVPGGGMCGDCCLLD
ncbi:(2Fe-2S)-binding protein [Streptomyces sp. NPDC006552]|uniref:(2Fe-2S)-binding protein n=1 Tax=Streptomyces sp. NPDC006552 TaxID=3157179 RepID=UPI0033A9E817